jgi:predicted dehydrogenase
MARRHLDVLQALREVQVLAVSSRGPERLRKLSEDYQIPETYLNNDEMLRNIKPDAAVVAVSAANVCDVTLTCIKHGVPTLLEKPPGLRAVETEQLLKISRSTNGLYMVGLNRRFYSVIRNAKKLVEESGRLVSILVQAPEDMASIRALNFHPKEVLEHWMAANGMHCIDLLRFLGGEVASVHAFSSASAGNVRDIYGALIRFQSGAIGHYVSNWASPGRWQVTLYGVDMRVDLTPLEEGTVSRRDGSVQPLPKDDIDLKFKAGFYGQDKYFVEHVMKNLPIERPGADLKDALGTMRLVETIAYSQENW